MLRDLKTLRDEMNGRVLSEVIRRINPLAKEIPKLHENIVGHLKATNVARCRRWSEARIGKQFEDWANAPENALENDTKPPLDLFLAAVAAHDTLPHRDNSKFECMVRARGLIQWADEQIMERAQAKDDEDKDHQCPKMESREDGMATIKTEDDSSSQHQGPSIQPSVEEDTATPSAPRKRRQSASASRTTPQPIPKKINTTTSGCQTSMSAAYVNATTQTRDHENTRRPSLTPGPRGLEQQRPHGPYPDANTHGTSFSTLRGEIQACVNETLQRAVPATVPATLRDPVHTNFREMLQSVVFDEVQHQRRRTGSNRSQVMRPPGHPGGGRIPQALALPPSNTLRNGQPNMGYRDPARFGGLEGWEAGSYGPVEMWDWAQVPYYHWG